MKTNISESNKWAIHDFAVLNNRERIQGGKLKALHKLIQSKGEIVETSSDHRLKDQKVLEYDKGSYIGLKRTGFGKGFFPCKIDIITLQRL